MTEATPPSRGGLLYALACYGLWGLAPLYFNALAVESGQRIGSDEILAHRVVWTVVFVAPLLTIWRRWPLVAACFRQPTLRWTLLATSVLVAANWFIYIYSVVSNQVLQSSLGYFINPLFNVLLGMVFFHERLRLLQWLAIGLAAVGVARMTWLVGELPWIALGLAGCFGTYGLLRKKIPVDGLVGLSFETFALLPLAVGYIIYLALAGRLALGHYGLTCDVLIFLSGVVTALPLMCFAQAARRLRLSTMGFLQFISPSLQFVCAVGLGEHLDEGKLMCFFWIWSGLAVYVVDLLVVLHYRSRA